MKADIERFIEDMEAETRRGIEETAAEMNQLIDAWGERLERRLDGILAVVLEMNERLDRAIAKGDL